MRRRAQVYIRCDGYTAVWPPSPVGAHILSAERAQSVCNLLHQGLLVFPPRIVPHGRANPIATNGTESGRAGNRRIEISVVRQLYAPLL